MSFLKIFGHVYNVSSEESSVTLKESWGYFVISFAYGTLL